VLAGINTVADFIRAGVTVIGAKLVYAFTRRSDTGIDRATIAIIALIVTPAGKTALLGLVTYRCRVVAKLLKSVRGVYTAN